MLSHRAVFDDNHGVSMRLYVDHSLVKRSGSYKNLDAVQIDMKRVEGRVSHRQAL